MRDRDKLTRRTLVELARNLSTALTWGTDAQVLWHARYIVRLLTQKETKR